MAMNKGFIFILFFLSVVTIWYMQNHEDESESESKP